MQLNVIKEFEKYKSKTKHITSSIFEEDEKLILVIT